MSDIIETELWRGKHVRLVKHSGYSSYSCGHRAYTPGEVFIEEHDAMYSKKTILHHLDVAPSPGEIAEWEKKGLTWGRVTKTILAALITQAKAEDAVIPARRKAEREKAEAEGKAQREAAAQQLERYGHRAAFAHKIQKTARLAMNSLHEPYWRRGTELATTVTPLDVIELARGFLEIADFKPCGGLCGRELPRAMFGFGCGFSDYTTNRHGERCSAVTVAGSHGPRGPGLERLRGVLR